ncbi:MAG TPA: acyl-[acyl-carrier-protein]--UDP-N-acetylglucosamine O-acyltransferase, partial [Nitratifractor sp.]|nr:acyl-[acyl-carrier-protein]--UDP-N-acetylglucosamine O-acyltransferase [Nitratifractor sp.]
QFVKVGDMAMVAGASAVSQDVPPYCLVEGNRAKLRGLNLTGLRRNMQSEDINKIKSAYRELFSGEAPIKEVAQRLAAESNISVQNLANFILSSTRGIAYQKSNK